MGIRDIMSALLSRSPDMTIDRALTVFDALAGNEKIVFGITDENCGARAYLMCRQLEQEGFKARKIWAFGGGERHNALRVEWPGNYSNEWDNHVAPLLAVKMPDGKVQDMVFDPALFDGPVPVRKWLDLIRAQTHEILRDGVMPQRTKKGAGKPFYAFAVPEYDSLQKAEGVMERERPNQGSAKRYVFPSGLRDSGTQALPGAADVQPRRDESPFKQAGGPVAGNPKAGF